MKLHQPRPWLAILAAAYVILLPGSASAVETILTFDPEASSLTFDFDTTLHGVEGTLHLTAGDVRFDLETGSASGSIVVDATRTETGNGARDRKMHRSVLESDRYPEIVYHPSAVSGSLDADGRGHVRLDGTVSIHGSDHPLALDADVAIVGDRLSAETEFLVPYVDWGMKNPSILILRVDKEVHVVVKAVGNVELASPPAAMAPTP
jgi:polyisoprenoid-binding protein YceI